MITLRCLSTVLVVLAAGGKVFFESYVVKNALGTGYSPRPAMDGDAIDAVTSKNCFLHFLMRAPVTTTLIP